MNGVYFGEIHSYHDLHLLLAPFAPTPAKPQTIFLKVPGRDGTLDLTEANGEVRYNDRTFSFTFTAAPNDELTFDERMSIVSNALNGQRCKITLDRDPGYYWLGRCVVNKVTRSKGIGKIVIKATVQPYKLKQSATVVSVALSSTAKTIVLENGRMSAVPTIECTNSGAVVTFNGTSYTLKAGTNKILDIRLTEGKNLLTVKGTGAMTITWQEGAL